jgi:hypothetical protein
MKFYLLLSLALMTLPVWAQVSYPKMPAGWMEGSSDDPIILNWIKTDPEKKFDAFSHVMVQEYDTEKKLLDFIKLGPLDAQGCRSLKDGGWDQTWCEKKDVIRVILFKGSSAEVDQVIPQIKNWMMNE